MFVYADNAATTKMSEKAKQAMLPFLDEVYGNASSLHSCGQRAREALEAARADIAKCLSAQPREIYFTSGGSEADNQAILSAAAIGEKKGKKHIISTTIEHHAVLHTLDKLKKRGFEITLLPVDGDGLVSAGQVASAIREDTCLVSVMYANNEIGTIEPIAEIGKVCAARGVLFHTDAVQAAGHIDIDVVRDNISLLSLSAHKFHGAKGCGVLYAKKGIKLTSLINGGEQERGMRAGTENVAACVAAAAALSDECENMAENTAKILAVREQIIDGLLKIPHTVLNGSREKRLPGNINVCFEGIEGESILLLLDAKGIMASSGSACTSGSLEPSHVLLAIGRTHDTAHGSLRLSLSAENTAEQAEYIIKQTGETVERLRAMSPVWREIRNKEIASAIK